MPKSLVLFVEGSDDRRFVEKIFYPRLARATYSTLVVIEHSKMDDSEVDNLIRGFNGSGEFFDYLFLADRDDHRSRDACSSAIRRKYPAAKAESVNMVCAEIESWYLAGLTRSKLAELGVKFSQQRTDEITKEDFNALIPSVHRASRLVFLTKVLSMYSVSEAKRKNDSFREFCARNQAVVSRS